MPTRISPLAEIHTSARIGNDVTIGPFCLVGPDVTLADDCILDSHVVITGRTTIGAANRFWPNCVIGGEPQDKSYVEGDTETVIGSNNQFREGVTVHRGSEKEDGVTRIGDRNLLMANSHVAHNCRVYNDTIIVNGVLLGGHAHIHDRAVISGNCVVHHFTSVGRCAMVGGGSRVTVDVPPYMMAFGSDCISVRNINLIGLQRAGVSAASIALIKQAYRLLFRQLKPLAEVRQILSSECEGQIPVELSHLFEFLELQRKGKSGRGREAVRDLPRPLTKAA